MPPVPLLWMVLANGQRTEMDPWKYHVCSSIFYEFALVNRMPYLSYGIVKDDGTASVWYSKCLYEGEIPKGG